jgi:hypothetical protein
LKDDDQASNVNGVTNMAIKIIKKTPLEPALAESTAKTQEAPTMALEAVQPPTLQPEAQEAPKAANTAPMETPQDILTALRDFANLPPKSKKTLMLVHRGKGTSWKVLGHDLDSGRTRLVSTDNIEINPILRQREVNLYYPLWR